MTIVYRQCNDATSTEIALGTTYEADCQDRNIIFFLKRVRTVCFESDKRSLSFGPYKEVLSVKSLNNFSNNKPHDPKFFKEEIIKIKLDAINAVIEKFPNGTEAMMELLIAELILLT